MNDARTRTMERGLTVWSGGVGWVEEGKRKKNWDNCNEINNKK